MNTINAYVDVLTLIKRDGAIILVKIYWSDGRTFTIEKHELYGMMVSDGGRIGMLYRVTLKGQIKNLYYDKSCNRWFVDLPPSSLSHNK